MAGVALRLVATMLRGGERFMKVSVSGRTRWVSERGYAQMQKMASEGASATKIRKSMQSYTIRKTLGFRKTITSVDSIGKTVTKRVGVLGKKRIMIRNLAKAMDKTGVPKDIQREIVKELKGMSEKEIFDFFEDPENQKYLEATFRYKETDESGNVMSIEDPQMSTSQLRDFTVMKKKSAASLLVKLKARHQTVLS